MEARWKFNPTYAPPAIVAATQDARGLLGLGKRAMNVNKLVGLIRGKKGFGGGGGGATDDGGLLAPNVTADGGLWAAPVGGRQQQAGGTLPQRLLRAITASGTQLRVSLNGGVGGGQDSPTSGRGGLFGRREQVLGDTGMADVQARRAPRRSFSANPSFRTRATTTSIPSPFTHDMSPLGLMAAGAREGAGSAPGTRGEVSQVAGRAKSFSPLSPLAGLLRSRTLGLSVTAARSGAGSPLPRAAAAPPPPRPQEPGSPTGR